MRGKDRNNKKWRELQTYIKRNRIAIIAVQETKLTQDIVAEIQNQLSEITILSNSSYSNKEGVAFAINKDIIKKKEIMHKIIIPNRASYVEIEWGEEQRMHIINVYADKLAGIGARKMKDDEIDLEIPEEWKIEGARLQMLSLKEMYQHIRKRMQEKPRKAEKYEMLRKDAAEQVEALTGKKPTEQQIFKGIKEPIEGKIGDFIWKIIHNSNRCGEEYFKHFKPEAQYCKCGEVESVDHILLECRWTHQNKAWDYIGEIWKTINKVENNNNEWKKPSIGLIRGIGAVQIKKGERADKGLTSLYKILITETVWILWKGRNERVINDNHIDEKEILWKIKDRLVERMQLDWLKIKWTEKRKREKARNELKEIWCRGGVLATVGDRRMAIHIPKRK